MRLYNYRFVWIDKNGKSQRSYIEAASEVDAIKDFEETMKITKDKAGAVIRRMT